MLACKTMGLLSQAGFQSDTLNNRYQCVSEVKTAEPAPEQVVDESVYVQK